MLKKQSDMITYPREAQVSTCDEAIKRHVDINTHIEADAVSISYGPLPVDVLSVHCRLLIQTSRAARHASVVLCRYPAGGFASGLGDCEWGS